VHGANRLGTNSLLDIIVFGRRGGIAMAAYAAGASFPELPQSPEAGAEAMLAKLWEGDLTAGAERVAPLRTELQEVMMRDCGVVRTEASLARVEGAVAELRERYANAAVEDRGRAYNTDLLEGVELGCLLDLAEVTVVAARARTESRGGHYREDFPARDDTGWMRHSLATRAADGSIDLSYKPVTVTRYPPMERKY